MAEAEILHDVVDLKAAEKASAQTVCAIAYWATRARATGPVQCLTMAPGKDSGKYSQKFDSVVYADRRDENSQHEPRHRHPMREGCDARPPDGCMRVAVRAPVATLLLNLYRHSKITSDGIFDIDSRTSSHLMSNS